MTTLKYQPPSQPKSTEMLNNTIQEISKLSEHSKVGSDNTYTDMTAPPSIMKKVKSEQHVKHMNLESTNTALANAMNDEK